MHYYQHNIADFNNATRHLTRVERSLYRDMIELYYDKEQPLPLDETQLFRRVLAVTDEEKQAVKNVLADFFVLSDEGWRHGRCDTEIEAYHAKQEQQSRAGKASAAKRGNRKTTTDEPTNNQQSTNVERPLNGRSTTDEPTNNHKPITNNHKPNIKTSITQSADADAVVCAGVELNEHQAEAEEIPSETQQKPKKAKPSKADAWKALLAENGIVGQLADDYIAIRLAKNAPLTATAMEGLKREAAKAGMTLEQAITYSTEQGWQGFKAEWLLNKVFGSGGGNQSKPQNRINDLPKHTQGGAFLAKDIF